MTLLAINRGGDGDRIHPKAGSNGESQVVD